MDGRSQQEKRGRKREQFSVHGFSQSSRKAISKLANLSIIAILRATCARKKKGRPALRRNGLDVSIGR
jgi:hypothetical protein